MRTISYQVSLMPPTGPRRYAGNLFAVGPSRLGDQRHDVFSFRLDSIRFGELKPPNGAKVPMPLANPLD